MIFLKKMMLYAVILNFVATQVQAMFGQVPDDVIILMLRQILPKRIESVVSMSMDQKLQALESALVAERQTKCFTQTCHRFLDLRKSNYQIQAFIRDINHNIFIILNDLKLATNGLNDAVLHIADKGMYEGLIPFLVSQGANINTQERGSYTPLHFAALRGFDSVARILIGNHANLEALDQDRLTPLHVATINDHLSIVMALVEAHANINAQANCGYTPLHLAVLNNRESIIQFLLSRGADRTLKNKQQETPDDLATKKAA